MGQFEVPDTMRGLGPWVAAGSPAYSTNPYWYPPLSAGPRPDAHPASGCHLTGQPCVLESRPLLTSFHYTRRRRGTTPQLCHSDEIEHALNTAHWTRACEASVALLRIKLQTVRVGPVLKVHRPDREDDCRPRRGTSSSLTVSIAAIRTT